MDEPTPDYYAILNLPKGASDVDIKRAYRKLAISHHPDKNPTVTSPSLFHSISEAYSVLSDPAKKAVYDQYGYKGLTDGVPDVTGKSSGAGSFDDPQARAGEIFEAFFGTSNPFSDFGFSESKPFTARLKKSGPVKGTPILADLPCTLEEIYSGCVKKLKITHKRLVSSESSSSGSGEVEDVDKILTVHVKPGWKTGTKITFLNEGDHIPGGAHTESDIIFTITEVPHAKLVRKGKNLIFNASVSLVDALTECSLQIPTLDGRTINIPVPEVITPGYTKVIEGEGMVDFKGKAGARGDLIVVFSIVFPRFLDAGKKKVIREVLCGVAGEGEKGEEKKE